jgi:hypothetical protein
VKPETRKEQGGKMKAIGWAKAELCERHYAEYEALVAFYKKELGIVEAPKTPKRDRPIAPRSVK